MRNLIYLVSLGVILTGCGKADKGIDGLKGQDAMPCSVSKLGYTTTIACPDGTTSTLVDGRDGIDGRDGRDGQDGQIGEAVKLCNSGTAGNYPEYGLCIQNELYAVMWQGGTAWLAKITPGTYQTTAQGGTCSFVVSPNCKVQ